MPLFQLGASATAFAGFYSLMQVSGFHMQISDAVVLFANKYYDKSQENYIAKKWQNKY